MNQKERRDCELPYKADEAVVEEMKCTRKLVHDFNTADPCDFENLEVIAAKLIPNADGAPGLTQPFYCDYGTHIYVGKIS